MSWRQGTVTVIVPEDDQWYPFDDVIVHSLDCDAFLHSSACKIKSEREEFEAFNPPGDINTQPYKKIVFNAPLADNHTNHVKIINAGGRRIGWVIKTTNMKRLGVYPACGVLDPKEAVLLAVSCDAFFGLEDTSNDRITIEWTNTPDDAAKQFRYEWFQGDGMVRRKNLPIEYNL